MKDIPPPPPLHADLAARILAGGEITADDVLILRQGVFADGAVDKDEVDLIFYLNDQDVDKGIAWKEFFVDALTDYFVWKQQPRGVLSDADGALLIDRITRDGEIEHDHEFALIVNLIFKAREVPEDVVLFALEALEDNVLKGSGKLFGAGRRRAGVIDEGEVEAIRMVIFGSGGGGGLTVTRREAELLFRLNTESSGKKNAATWRELFVTAVGCYLMLPQGPPGKIDVQEIRRRDESLAGMASGEGVFAMLIDVFSNLDPAHGRAERRKLSEKNRRDLDDAHAAVEREKIDRAEIDWLIERLDEDDNLDGNERALLAYIKHKAVDIDPALDPYFEKYGI